jgi:uncharacterized protein YlzI (FlbEa/FlbD family)
MRVYEIFDPARPQARANGFQVVLNAADLEALRRGCLVAILNGKRVVVVLEVPQVQEGQDGKTTE